MLLLWLGFGAVGVGLIAGSGEPLRPRWIVRRSPVACVVLAAGLILGAAGTVRKLHSGELHIPSRRQVDCAKNLKQIGLAMYEYAEEHEGNYPDTLGGLLAFHGDAIALTIFVCADTTDTPAVGSTAQERGAQLDAGGHGSYVYLGKGKSRAAPANTVLVYEPLGRHRGKGLNVLFGDGRVFFLDAAAGAALSAELDAGHNPPRAGTVTFPKP